jgi:hypothetical protein
LKDITAEEVAMFLKTLKKVHNNATTAPR